MTGPWSRENGDLDQAFDALAELSHLENRTSEAEALQIAVAQMIAGAWFIEMRAGKAKADKVLASLCCAQLG